MRILIVEEEPKISHALWQGLTEVGHSVDESSNPMTSQLSADLYDLIILDSDFENPSLCSSIKIWAGINNVPIVILADFNHQIQEFNGDHGNQVSFLKKPFGFTELLKRIDGIKSKLSNPN